MGVMVGSIMPAIIAAHIAHSSNTCGASHCEVIIHALAPVIDPYMSRAMTITQVQHASGSPMSSAAAAQRSARSADSSSVGGRSWGEEPIMRGAIVAPRRWPDSCTLRLFSRTAMPEFKAYAALSADQPLVPFQVERRDPRPDDVTIEIKFCGKIGRAHV